MGTRFCVDAWLRDEVRANGVTSIEYTYSPVYRGSSLLVALYRAARARRTSGCVRIEWR